MDLNKTIGINIKKARKERGYTQDQFAAQLQVAGCDVSRGTLAKIEVGIRELKVSELPIFLELLKIDLKTLYME
ncbi:MAG: helix-turn-helix domain-containing protein [Clostridiales bacterium]|nr:helix-turn-helix domain-containing protein [Clostridiales bacterium]